MSSKVRPAKASFRTPHSALRAGISLMEVLISIGIVAVGLLSVASLLPVGSIQSQRAAMEDSKATLGLNAFRDFKIRGFGRPEWWVTTARVAYDPTPPNFTPVAIDPLMVASANPNESNVARLPLNASAGPWMPRLTVRAATTGTGPFTPNAALSEGIAMATDDQVIAQPTDVRLHAVADFQRDASKNPVKRLFEGKYTWLATITPIEHDPEHAVAEAQRQFLLSVVIMHRRALALGTDTTLVGEAQVNADNDTSNVDGISGGEFILSSTTTAQLALAKPGQWLMLCRTEQWSDHDGNPGTPAANVFKWYRIVSAEPYTTGMTQRRVTLTGPDWKKSSSLTGAGATFACLFEGAIAVYQRPIRLEGPGVWGN